MDKFTLPFEEPIREIERQIETRRADPAAKGPEFEKEIRDLEARRLALIQEIFSKLSAWDRVRIARHPSRPTSVEYIGLVFEDFLDIHGDRRFGDDKAVIAGFARIGGRARRLHRPAEGAHDEGEARVQLRHAAPGRLPEGAARDETGGEVRAAGRDVH